MNLNVVPSHGSGSTYKVFTAAAALSAGFGAHYSIYAPQPYTSKVYKGYRNKVFGPLVCQRRPQLQVHLRHDVGLVASSNTYYVALEDALGSIDGPVDTAVAMGMHFNGPVNQHSADSTRRTSRALHPRPRRDQPAGPGQRLFHRRRERHAVRPHAGDQDPRSERPAAQERQGRRLDTGDHCKPNAIAPGVANTLANMMVGVVSPRRNRAQGGSSRAT